MGGDAAFVILEEARVDEVEDAAEVVLERPVDFDRLDDVITLADAAARGRLCRPRNLELEVRLFQIAVLLFRF